MKKMLVCLAMAGLLVAGLAVGPAGADPTHFLNNALEAVRAGQMAAALKQIDMAAFAVWNRLPFRVDRAYLVTQKANGYGDIKTRANRIYAPGEVVRMYIDFQGYKVRKAAKGYQFGLDAFLSVTGDDGQMLMDRKQLVKARKTSRGFQRMMFLNLSFRTPRRAGVYQIRVDLQDPVGRERAAVRWKILLRDPAGQQQPNSGGSGGFHQQQPYTPREQQPPPYPGSGGGQAPPPSPQDSDGTSPPPSAPNW